MTSAPETLPEDPAQLKAYALSQQREIQRLNLIIAKLNLSGCGLATAPSNTLSARSNHGWAIPTSR